ncbi:condensation domain-containing protein [Streptomyces sp. NPDC015350]|uniref:condensation domain-containing protein n=1 Tax=Streptomyces sp. NPDC015350 TaxID=3364955 RepID=UPI0036F8178F
MRSIQRIQKNRGNEKVTDPRISSAWRKILGTTEAGPDDNFFASGGQSLTAAKLAVELSKEFGHTVSLRAIYDNPTLEKLSAHLTESTNSSTLQALRPGTAKGAIPLTKQQESAFAAHQRDPGYNLLNTPAAFMLDGEFNHSLMAAALRMVVQRHDALRTTFRQVEGTPEQVVGLSPRLDLKIADVAEGNDLAELINGEVQRPFDPGSDLPMRVRVWKVAPNSSAVVFIFNHMCVDGWSVNIILREFCLAYAHLTLDNPLELPPVGAQQADFARWQSTHEERYADQLRFWLDKWSDGFRDTVLPVDLPQSEEGRREGASINRALSTEDTKLLVEFSHAHAVSPFSVLLAAWHIVLLGSGGPSHQFFRIATANRALAEFENTVGWLSHGLLVQLNTKRPTDFAGIVRRSWAELEDTSRNQDVPLESVAEHLTSRGRPTGSSVGSCTLTLQPDPLESLDVPGLRFRHLELPPVAAAKRDLSWYFFLGSSNLRAHIVYSSSSYQKSTVEALFDDLAAVVRHGCQDSSLPVPELARLVQAFRVERD